LDLESIEAEMLRHSMLGRSFNTRLGPHTKSHDSQDL
jgi:hypothetical protein